jgi:deoxyribonuclease V
VGLEDLFLDLVRDALSSEPVISRNGEALPTKDVLLVDATGRDHPRRAGLALHLGAVLDLPTVGVTHRPLLADGSWPDDEPGARTPLVLEGGVVGYWVRTRPGTRPLAVHAAWRTEPETAVEVVLSALAGHRAPEPLRRARRAARAARAAAF